MKSDRLSERVRALVNDAPEGPPVTVNVSLNSASTDDEHREAISRLEKLSGSAVNFRGALGMATAIVPRHSLYELSGIDAIEHVDLDTTADPSELID